MLVHYLKVSLRLLFQNKLISAINLFSLAAGISALLLIAAYLEHEKQYDAFHEKGDRIFRAGFTYWDQGKIYDKEEPEFSALFGPDAKAELTGIEEYCRMSTGGQSYVSYGERSFKIDRAPYVDPSFFKLFSFKLLEGSPSEALASPHSIVLNRTTALKLFGDIARAVGKTVLLDGKKSFLVKGVIEDAPSNTDIRYSSLLSFSTLNKDPDAFLSWRGGYRYITYLLLNNKEAAAAVQKQLPGFMWRHINQSDAADGGKTEASLQPLRDIHLHYDAASASLSRNLKVFTAVAILILIISCVNYINFNTAQSFSRLREIGVRRVLGAAGNDLSFRWLTDSVLITTLSFIAAILLILALGPVVSRLTTTELSLQTLLTGRMVSVMAGIFILISAGAGAYLAFYLRRVNIRRNLNDQNTSGTGGLTGKAMIVLQFMISAALITCTLVIYRQVSFIKSHPTGIDRENMMILPLTGIEKEGAPEQIALALSELVNVRSVTALSDVPINDLTSNGFLAEGQRQHMMIHQLDADENFLKTFGLKMVSGRYFSKGRSTDREGYVINETLARNLGWKDAIGKTIEREGSHPVIGVVKDFNFASLHQPVEPLIITNKPWTGFRYLAVRYTTDAARLIKEARSVWKQNSGLPFDYWFMDSEFDRIYKSEQQFMNLLICFSLLSILLSLSGVFGLVSLNLQKRVKEFGIRKVLGATVTDIVALSSSGYLRLTVIALAIAIPVSLYLSDRWLADFAYRTSVPWWLFLLSALLVLGLTMTTVISRVIKAALTNPVKSLRTE